MIGVIDCIELSENWDRWCAAINVVINNLTSINCVEYFKKNEPLYQLASQEGLCCME
jgi:hypothetical protein